jgi:hypothetical protein
LQGRVLQLTTDLKTREIELAHKAELLAVHNYYTRLTSSGE